MNRILVIAILFTSVSQAQWSTDPTNNLIVGYGLLPELASDSAGGCYITYEQNLSYPRRLMLERLDRYGYKPWGTSRQILGLLPEQSFAKITEDGFGGVIASYLDIRVEGTPHLPEITARLRVQRVDSNGNFLWGSTGVRVTLSETNQAEQAIVSDGNGGCVVVWKDTMDAIRAQCIDSAGARTWGDTGVMILSSQYDVLLNHTVRSKYLIATGRTLTKLSPQGMPLWNIQMPFRARRLNSNEIEDATVTGFAFSPSGSIAYVGQSFDSLGTARWTDPYETLGDSVVSRFAGYPFATRDNGLFSFGWDKSEASATEVFAQILRANGTTVLPLGGVRVSRFPSTKGLVGVLPSDSISSLYVWGDSRSSGGIYAQRLDTLGQTLWDTNDVAISIPAFSYVKVATDGAGGAILAGSADNFSIRAQQVNKHGNLGQVITSVEDRIGHELPGQPTLYQNYPNPFNPQTTIRFQLPRAAQINLTLYNILGQSIKTLASGVREAGVHSVILEVDELPSGTYLYRLTTPEVVLIHKLIILK